MQCNLGLVLAKFTTWKQWQSCLKFSWGWHWSTFKNNGCWYYSGYNNYFSFLFACRILLIKTGRRWPYIICIFISGTAFLLMLPFERGVYPSDWPIVVMAMIGNLFVSTTFAMIWMYTPELFPTNIRWKICFRFYLTFKGQLISKCLIGSIISTKKSTIFF